MLMKKNNRGTIGAGLEMLVYVLIVVAFLALVLYFYYNGYYEKGIKPFMDRLFKGFGSI